MVEYIVREARMAFRRTYVDARSITISRCVYNDLPQDAPEPRPTISLFEHWEEGAHLPVALDARNYSFPSSLVIPFMWIHSPASLSLSDAINNVSLHSEKRAWGQASQINLVLGVNYLNQPRSNPDSHLSDPLTYWRGVT